MFRLLNAERSSAYRYVIQEPLCHTIAPLSKRLVPDADSCTERYTPK